MRRRLLRLAKSLLWTNRIIAAIGNIFLVRFSTFMLVNMATIKHSFGKLKLFRLEPIQDVYVKNLLQLSRDRLQVVEAFILEIVLAGRRQRNPVNQLLHILTN